MQDDELRPAIRRDRSKYKLRLKDEKVKNNGS
jgi:hypothetical protein